MGNGDQVRCVERDEHQLQQQKDGNILLLCDHHRLGDRVEALEGKMDVLIDRVATLHDWMRRGEATEQLDRWVRRGPADDAKNNKNGVEEDLVKWIRAGADLNRCGPPPQKDDEGTETASTDPAGWPRPVLHTLAARGVLWSRCAWP